MMIVLRRKAVRQFGAQRVALYTNDALKLEVSIPYEPGHVGGIKPVAKLREEAHDEMYGEYLHHLTRGDHKSAEHIAGKVEREYGSDAVKHFRNAGNFHVEGRMKHASHAYGKFEDALKEHVDLMEQAESGLLEEGILHKLRHIARSGQFGDVTFKRNGKSTRIDPADATKVLRLWSSLHKAGHVTAHKKIERMINSDHGGYTQVLKFADEHMKHPGNAKERKRARK